MSNTYWIQFIYSTKLTEARKKNNALSISVCKNSEPWLKMIVPHKTVSKKLLKKKTSLFNHYLIENTPIPWFPDLSDVFFPPWPCIFFYISE